jgi:hypothetical protein
VGLDTCGDEKGEPPLLRCGGLAGVSLELGHHQPVAHKRKVGPSGLRATGIVCVVDGPAQVTGCGDDL